jgi:hypothetical protein
MPIQTSTQLGPEFTPKPILNLMGILAFVSIFSSLTSPLFSHLLGWNLVESFSLSWQGLRNWFIWQPFTFPFVEDGGRYGISFFYLLGLGLNIYLIWVIGTSVWEKIGNNAFLGLFFGSAIGAGLLSILLMPVIGQYALLSGPGPGILGLLVVWTMLNPKTIVSFLFSINVVAKWLLAGILGAIALIGLSQLDFINTFFNLSGAFLGYLFGLVHLNVKSPYGFTQRFDGWVIKLSRKVKKLWRKLSRKKEQADKVVDISTGEPIRDDEQFVDEMLAKISRHGENSLSWSERQRMKRISEKKRDTTKR